MTSRRVFLTGFGLAALAALAAAPAAANDLDNAKAAGLVGERPDGYLGLVSGNAPPSVRALVDQVNAARRSQYSAIANRTGTNPRDVGILAGRRLIAGSPRGTFVMDSGGGWRRK